MEEEVYKKELKYLTELAKSKEKLIKHYSTCGNLGAVEVLHIELERVNTKLTALKVAKVYSIVGRSVSVEELSDLFN